jgi:hypothetical protein
VRNDLANRYARRGHIVVVDTDTFADEDIKKVYVPQLNSITETATFLNYCESQLGLIVVDNYKYLHDAVVEKDWGDRAILNKMIIL